jgi:hypothetical protein
MHFPIDLLHDKHELMSFDLDETECWQPLEVEHDDRIYRVQVPIIYDNGVERVLRVDDAGDLLFLFGEVGHDFGKLGRIGCLIVARPNEDGSYRTVVFHSLYPQAIRGIERGGLAAKSGS